ncbi:MAG TPA: hypothetical protein VE981_20430 [Planctomycetota bacterium]|nr:hypothetical protein [Planctomycetota bacterium]
MELECAIAREARRLAVVADAAAVAILAPRPWWIGALAFLRKVVR